MKAEPIKSLVCLKNGNIIKIPNSVLRKPISLNDQNKYLCEKSICIVSKYVFLEQKINFSPKIKCVCHPFRDDGIFENSIKKYLLSTSDFCDKYLNYYNEDFMKDKLYDFVCFSYDSPLSIKIKGLYLLELMDKVSSSLGLKGCCVFYGKNNRGEDLYGHHYDKHLNERKKFKNIKFISGKVSSKKICKLMMGSNFTFFPNLADASPRLLSESLIRNTPVVVNSNIYGGWKYVNKKNGGFFDAITIEGYIEGKNIDYSFMSLKKVIEYVMNFTYIDRKNISLNFYENYGFKNTSIRLAKIINDIYNEYYDAVSFYEWENVMSNIFLNKG